jgi:acyl-CoA thioesterase-1
MTADIRICFVGDSFVNGTGDETALGWAGRLCASAAKRGVPVTYYNLGVRRNTSKDILMRWENEVAHRLPDTCDGRVVVSCGVNDTVVEDGKVRIRPEESCANLRAILDGARKHKVILVGPPPVDDDQQNERIRSLSDAFAREAGRLGVPFIELFSALAADNAYIQEISSGDGAHPGSKGYTTIAAIISSSPSWWFHWH